VNKSAAYYALYNHRYLSSMLWQFCCQTLTLFPRLLQFNLSFLCGILPFLGSTLCITKLK